MTRNRTASNQDAAALTLAALKRAAKSAVELARRTGTPAYVLENGKLIDVAKRAPKKATTKNRRG